MSASKIFTASRLFLRLLLVSGALVLLSGCLYLLRHPIVRSYGAMITHVDPLQPSDAIVLLMGDLNSRPAYAARLFRSGVAPRIVFAPPEQVETSLDHLEIASEILRRSGVPDSALEVLPGTMTSTRDEAKAVRSYVAATGADVITIVTSPYHTARARYTFRKMLEGLPVEVRMAAAPEWAYEEDEWWKSETGIADYGMEIPKWVNTILVLSR